MKEFVTLTLGEKPWIFRALDLDQLEAMEPQFATINASAGTNDICRVTAIITPSRTSAHGSFRSRMPLMI